MEKTEMIIPQAVPVQVMSLDDARKRQQELEAYVRGQLKEGQDYGTIPGTTKPSLFKAGAEKLKKIYGLTYTIEMVDSKQDWDIGVFSFTYRATVHKFLNGVDLVLAQADGEANSKEKKYLHTDGFSVRNTLCKIAQKRAVVAATVAAVGASDLFTQDMEDTPQYGESEVWKPLFTLPTDMAQKAKTENWPREIRTSKNGKNIMWVQIPTKTDPNAEPEIDFPDAPEVANDKN